MASIVLDDKTNRLKIGGGTWSGVTIERFFENGAIWPAFAIDDNGDTGTYGTLSISFLGTSISFFGNTPSAKASQNIFVSIDGGIPYSTSYGDPSPPTALQWYQSPLLSDSTHTIDITHLAGTSVDYMVITAGQNTPLSGETLIVDDSDSAIAYEGKWATNVGRYTSRDNPRQGLPYGNGTHQASTSGSSATFRFAGTAISIYSVFDWSKLGSLIVLYTLDGSTTSKTYAVSSSMDEFTSGLTQRENTLMFSSNSLSPGPHTLKMEVKESSNQVFALDYILYSPSFNTLATKPDLPPVVAPTGSTSPSSPTPGGPTQSTVSPGVSSGSSTGSNTRPTGPLTGSDTGLNSSANTSHSPPVGAIVGGVISGIALLGFFLAFFLCRKRISKRFSSALAPPVDMSSRRPDPLSIEPFTVMSTNATAGSTAPLPGGFGTFSPVRKPGRPGLTMHSYRSHSRMGSSPPTFSVFTPPMSQHKSSHSLSSSGVGPQPALTPVRREYYQEQDGGNVTNGSTLPPGGLLRSRMQRLQNLVLELNRTIVEEGEEGARVAELRGRIAELTREDVADIGGGGGGGAREMEERRQSVATTAIPPPYEPRRA